MRIPHKFLMIIFFLFSIFVTILILRDRPIEFDNSKYCKIDSISTFNRYQFMPVTVTKYHTDCGFVFSSDKAYNIGDSIKINIVKVE